MAVDVISVKRYDKSCRGRAGRKYGYAKEKEGKRMSLRVVMFDLDGTLLPMDQDEFTKGYFKLLAGKLAPYGYEPKSLVDAVWAGTAAMVKNNGGRSNEAAFWESFAGSYGEQKLADKPIFEEFYKKEFQEAAAYCGCNPKAAQTVAKIGEMGYRLVLATNPIFPAIATESRIRWAGLEPDAFEFYTAYENACYCKPNPDYYREILKRLEVLPEECLMVGNDVTEDMVAEVLGMKVFLLTDCLINKDKRDISVYPHGSFEQLLDFVTQL